MYLESPVSLNFYTPYFFIVNGPQALYVNPGCLKCVSGMNLSLANKSLVHKKIFSLVWQVVFKLGYAFCQER